MEIPFNLTNILILTGLVLAVICGLLAFLAAFAEYPREIVMQACRAFFIPLHNASTWCRSNLTSSLDWLKDQITSETADGSSRHVISAVIGNVISSALFVLVVIADIGLLALMFDAIQVPADLGEFIPLPGRLLVFSILGLSLYYPMLILECLGITHFIPWTMGFAGLSRKGFLAIVCFLLCVTLTVFITMAVWRAFSLNDSILSSASLSLADNTLMTEEVPDFNNLDLTMANMQDTPKGLLPPAWVVPTIFIGSSIAMVGATGLTGTSFIVFLKMIVVLMLFFIWYLPMLIVTGFLTLLSFWAGTFAVILEKMLEWSISVGQGILGFFSRTQKNTRDTENEASGLVTFQENKAEEKKPIEEDLIKEEEGGDEIIIRPSVSGFDPFGAGGPR